MDFQPPEVIARLSERERNSLLFGGVVLFFFMTYSFLLEPLFVENELLLGKLEKDRQELSWMRGSVERWQQQSKKKNRGGDASLPKGKSLLGVVDNTVKRFRLKETLRRIEPDGKNGVKLSYEGVSFDSLIKWLGMMERKYGVVVVRMNLSARYQLGDVNARVSLQTVKRKGL
jgi:type II secretory pathway component PulM